MTDKYEALRAALDTLSAETEGRGIPWFDREQDLREVVTGEFEPEFSRLPETDMNYIAAAHPETIRALLAERDALRAALTDLADWAEFDVGADPALTPGLEYAREILAQHQGEKHG